jgi:hypothetical protein
LYWPRFHFVTRFVFFLVFFFMSDMVIFGQNFGGFFQPWGS